MGHESPCRQPVDRLDKVQWHLSTVALVCGGGVNVSVGDDDESGGLDLFGEDFGDQLGAGGGKEEQLGGWGYGLAAPGPSLDEVANVEAEVCRSGFVKQNGCDARLFERFDKALSLGAFAGAFSAFE